LPFWRIASPRDHHDEHDQRALDHLALVLVDSAQDHQRLHEGEDERRRDRPDQAADAAEQ